MKCIYLITVIIILSFSYGIAQSNVPGPRAGHSLVYDEGLNLIVLLDGYTPPNQPEYTEIWTWDGEQWQIVQSQGPAGRTLGAAVYDSGRERIISYGGLVGDQNVQSDTWEWDGLSWQQMEDTTVGARDHHAMAYFEASGKTIMYGGAAESRSLSSDTWEWDGLKWTKVSSQGPGGLVHFAMTYDRQRQQIVLFGGLIDGQTYSNETWIWDGSTWLKVSTEGPTPRARHRMAFDDNAGVVILYGGDRGSVLTPSGWEYELLEDMWQWDGQQWIEIETSGPGKRFMHAMAYDKERGKTVLYGGSDGLKDLSDTWEWDGTQWLKKSDGITGIEPFEIPVSYLLEQNFPNPFNPRTRINYSIKDYGFVTLKVYDILGNEISTLVNEPKASGNYTADFNASNLSSGVYIYTINANGFTASKKLAVTK